MATTLTQFETTSADAKETIQDNVKPKFCVHGGAQLQKPTDVEALKKEFNKLMEVLKGSGLSDGECMRNAECQQMFALLQEVAQARAQNAVKPSRRKKRGGPKCQQQTEKVFGKIFECSASAVSTPSTQSGEDSDSEALSEAVFEIFDEGQSDSGSNKKKDHRNGVANMGLDVETAAGSGKKKKKGSRRVNASVDRDSETNISTRCLMIDGLTPEKQLQVQERSNGMQVVNSYRRKNQGHQDKKRNDQREFKIFQQKQGCL